MCLLSLILVWHHRLCQQPFTHTHARAPAKIIRQSKIHLGTNPSLVSLFKPRHHMQRKPLEQINKAF